MSGPFAFSRQMMPVDQLLASTPTWEGLLGNFAPAQVAQAFEPEGELKKMLWAFSQTAQGRQMFEWLADLTVRAPYPHVGNSLEAAGIAAAKHEARVAVGHSIFLAVAQGEVLIHQTRSQTDENPA